MFGFNYLTVDYMHTCFEYSARQNFLCLINIYKWWNCAFSWGILTGKLRWHYKLQYMIAMLFVQIPLLWPFRHLGSNTGSLVKYTRSIFLIACEISRVVIIFFIHIHTYLKLIHGIPILIIIATLIIIISFFGFSANELFL